MGVWSEHKFNQNLRSGSNTYGDDATVLFSVIEQVHAKLHTGWVVPWHPGALPSITNWKAFALQEQSSIWPHSGQLIRPGVSFVYASAA